MEVTLASFTREKAGYRGHQTSLKERTLQEGHRSSAGAGGPWGRLAPGHLNPLRLGLQLPPHLPSLRPDRPTPTPYSPLPEASLVNPALFKPQHRLLPLSLQVLPSIAGVPGLWLSGVKQVPVFVCLPDYKVTPQGSACGSSLSPWGRAQSAGSSYSLLGFLGARTNFPRVLGWLAVSTVESCLLSAKLHETN